MDLVTYAQTMARYNRWMNRSLYAACARVPDVERKRDAGAFFRSLHGTLNHLLLVDRLWLGRFKAEPFAFTALDQELYADFDELGRERERTDAEILAWADTLTCEQLDAPLTFRSASRGQDFTFRLGALVMHLFNHQTHHRGQLTTLLKQAGHDPGVTDLPLLPGFDRTAPR
jgi:uncharacterized damage-inducible protein DinB